ncbi:heavy metal translocatin [Lactifluus subvellereus]|nr:heavy metal translocatin [Lactifluus subvellereus]
MRIRLDISSFQTGGERSEDCCKGPPVSRDTCTEGPTHLSDRPYSRASGGKTRNLKCRSQATFGRFFEAACCCLIDRRVRPPKQYHHDAHAHSHLRSDVKKQHKKSTRPLQGHHPVAPEGVAEQGGGAVQTLVLSVQGMDCATCSPKVIRALLTLPSIQDVKVNTFTGQASMTYREGLVFPPDIAKRVTEFTGFVCTVLDDAQLSGKVRLLRIKVPTCTGSPREFPKLPPGVVILETSRTASSMTLDVQYDAAVIQPRTVLDIFVPFGGSFLPPSRSNASAQIGRENFLLFRRTLISAILCIPVIIFSWAPLRPHPIQYGAVSLFLATCIQIYVGAPLYSAACRALFLQHVLEMDALVVLSSTTAYVFSLVAYGMQVAGHGFSTPFFETPALLLTLITLGRLISAYARRRATSALDGLGSLQPELVNLVSTDGATATSIHVDLVQPHDVLRVSANTLVPTDGVVSRGSTQVDESALTGESRPVDKAPGVLLTAGTRNMTSCIDMEVTRAPAENTLAELTALVTRLQEARLPVQDLADRVAEWLAPVILAVAIAVFVIWVIIGLRVRGEDTKRASLAALRYAIAVLIVSCPCAVVLCVPMVIVIAGAVAIREGVLFKTATAVQHAKNATVAVFDKTGTLTFGNMTVVEARILREDAVGTVLALASESSHPVAKAVAEYLRAAYPHISAAPLPSKVQSLTGQGLQVTVDGVQVRGGSPSWLGLQSEPLYSVMMQKALSMFAVTFDTEVVVFFGLSDLPRPSARAAIEFLQRQGIQVHIVSGDAPPVVGALAKELGIPSARALGGCLPTAKVARVRALQTAGARVMFIGDGTNDTPALAAADIGVAMGGGTDAARSAADVVFLAPDLERALAALFRRSRGAVRRVCLNFAWAFVYNLFAVLLAAGAFLKVRIAPEYAGLGEIVSVVPVVLVAWSMRFLKY